MDDIANLIIRVDSTAPEKAAGNLERLTNSAARAEKSVGGLASSFKTLLGPLLATVSATAALSKLVSTAKTFESLDAQLKTATGSAEKAKQAFAALQDFARETPYDLQQTTEAFIKLVNLGLTPSERALRSYGDTASAMGAQLSDMVLAVAKATAGEFVILKERFGILAKNEGDTIEFTFRGVTESVKNNARDIESYMIRLGENNFAGAMAERMATLEGKLSNLGDSWDQLFATIADAGAGDLIKQGVDLAIVAIEDLTALIKSGELAAMIDALKNRFAVFGEDAKYALSLLTSQFTFDAEQWRIISQEVADSFLHWPENVRAAVQGISAWVSYMVLQVELAMTNVGKSITAEFNLLTDQLKALFAEVESYGSGKDFNYTDAILVAQQKYDAAMSKARGEARVQLDNINDAYGQTVTEIMNARDAVLDRYNKEIEKARELRSEYEKNLKIEKALNDFFNEDRTAGFRVGPEKPSQRASKREVNQFEDLQTSLFTEEQQVEDSYQTRLEIIRKGTSEGSDLRESLERELAVRRDTEMQNAHMEHASRLEDQYKTEQSQLDQALQDKQISEEEFHKRSLENWKKYQSGVSQISTGTARIVSTKQLEMYSTVLGFASDISGQMQELVEGNDKAAKAMFIAAKGIAIAQAIVYTELAATKALSEGGMIAGIPMSTAIRALGYASVALMGATAVKEYAGKFEHGGQIPAGSFGLVGETGLPEMVRGPAVVSSARATQGLLAGGGGGTNVQINVINQAGDEIEQTEREGPDGKIVDILIKRVKSEISAGVRNGSDPLSSAMEQTYNLRRGTR